MLQKDDSLGMKKLLKICFLFHYDLMVFIMGNILHLTSHIHHVYCRSLTCLKTLILDFDAPFPW